MSKTLTPEEQNEQANWCAALAEAAKLPLEDRISSPLRILSDRLPGIFAALRAERTISRLIERECAAAGVGPERGDLVARVETMHQWLADAREQAVNAEFSEHARWLAACGLNPDHPANMPAEVAVEQVRVEEREAALRAEREERKEDTAQNERLKRWVDDLHAGMYINCVYCGHRYGPNDEVPASMAEVLKEHVEQCPEHPMSKLKAEREADRRLLERCRRKLKLITSGSPLLRDLDARLGKEKEKEEKLCPTCRSYYITEDAPCPRCMWTHKA